MELDRLDNRQMRLASHYCYRAVAGGSLAAAAMLTAGIWHDWRWLLTAAIPAAVALVFGAALSTVNAEIRRRDQEAPDA